jgi:hypothetical protein
VVIIALSYTPGFAQLLDESTVVKYDTNYIKVYKDELTTRAYFSRKQNGYSLTENILNPGLKYKTNDNVLFGLGYTYSFLTLNFAVKLPLINRDEDLYGKSTYIDLSSHTIFRSYIIDLYLQWNKGYYVSNPEEIVHHWDSQQSIPIRGDLRTSIVGLNVQYLFNSERYSYKASFLQNEFQRKSAGSPMLGIEGYWMLGMGDSLVVSPTFFNTRFLRGESFNQVDIANVGVNGGYAYTFVWDEKLYLSVATLVGLSGGYNKVHHSNTSTTCCSGITFGITNSSRISLGYNSQSYYVGLSFIRFSMSNLVTESGDWITYSTGNIRFNIVKRFRLKRSIKILRPDLWIF